MRWPNEIFGPAVSIPQPKPKGTLFSLLLTKPKGPEILLNRPNTRERERGIHGEKHLLHQPSATHIHQSDRKGGHSRCQVIDRSIKRLIVYFFPDIYFFIYSWVEILFLRCDFVKGRGEELWCAHRRVPPLRQRLLLGEDAGAPAGNQGQRHPSLPLRPQQGQISHIFTILFCFILFYFCFGNLQYLFWFLSWNFGGCHD